MTSIRTRVCINNGWARLRPSRYAAPLWLSGAFAVCLALACPVDAATPSHDQLLPDSTQVYVHTDNFKLLQDRWDSTQYSKLYNDSTMESFRNEWRRYLAESSQGFEDRTGISIDELTELVQGKASLAQVATGQYKLAYVVLADVSDVRIAADALLAKGSKRLQDKGARRELRKLDGNAATIFSRTGKDKVLAQTIYLVKEGTLCIVTDLKVTEGILTRWSGGNTSSGLAAAEAYRETQAACDSEPNPGKPDARWFVDLVAYLTTTSPPETEGLEETNTGESRQK
ncbi:MAG: hypothetical protein N2C12_01620, partial [Planctomycetales bacterium]